jgi:TolA-binding protein
MKDDRPLLLDSDSEEMRTLLRSADLDEPPEGAKRRVLAGAGVGLGIVAAAATTAHAGAASHGAGGALAIGKWIAVAAVVGAGAAGTARYAGVMRSAAPVLATTKVAPSEPRPPAAMPEPPAISPALAADPAEEAPAPAPRVARSQKGAPASADISGEIAEIEAARRAFDRGSAREGLAAIDRYQQDYPRGTLQPEATVLRIEGLVAVGDRARARSIGEAFLKSHPKSPHAQRVRSLIGSGNP